VKSWVTLVSLAMELIIHIHDSFVTSLQNTVILLCHIKLMLYTGIFSAND